MDSKRKANGAAPAESDDRSSKRRKLTDFDLSKGESRESTTAYGLNFLDQIRRTADKSGRPVATYFEKLLPRKDNVDYYKQTRMPISLETIEEKLNNGEFENLAELESYFKRMISNAKEFYPRSSTIYDDAERVRKALSNYMTKRNPAYATRRYQAHPTPLPPEDEQMDEAAGDQGEADGNDEQAEEQADEEMKDEEDKEDNEEEAKQQEEGEDEGDEEAEGEAEREAEAEEAEAEEAEADAEGEAKTGAEGEAEEEQAEVEEAEAEAEAEDADAEAEDAEAEAEDADAEAEEAEAEAEEAEAQEAEDEEEEAEEGQEVEEAEGGEEEKAQEEQEQEEEEEEAKEEEEEATEEAEKGAEKEEEEDEEEEAEEEEAEEEGEDERAAEEDQADDGAEDEDEDHRTGSKSGSKSLTEERGSRGASRSSRRSIVLKRRESGRLSKKKSSGQKVQASPRQSGTANRPDHQYIGVAYRGLSFQYAQEKLVEELIRYNEPEYEAYFEPFFYLPPRTLKDYYRVITSPASLKKIQRMVRGTHSRYDTAGVSEFKTWAALEEKCKLLWNNAYFYNEEGSEIFELAQELEESFYEELKKAQTAVPEPSQPKIKLKVGQAQEAPAPSKKITIHVGGRGGSTDSPAPNAPQPTAPPALNGSSATRSSVRLEAARGVSLSATPPVQPNHQAENGARMAAMTPVPFPAAVPGITRPTGPVLLPHPPPPQPPPPVNNQAMMANGHVEPRRFRRPGKGINDALIGRLRIQLHPNIMQAEGNSNGNPNLLTIMPHPTELLRSSAVTLSPHHNRVFIVLQIPEHLFHRQYSVWVLIDKQCLKPCIHPLPNQLPLERAFEVFLRPGMNVIETHLIAALPRGERRPGEPDVELEIFTAFVNLLRP
ncbi:hypothetical protein CP532_1433 [Ophiocordyceps camponoti-leonardi (nom. inval.)]|nr:hypothetical protein CP532_1433 [Ophiocordyceps camponoti-leonardi (nom. inval.)]